MRQIRLQALVPASAAASAFEQLTEFARFPSLAEDVRAVTVHPQGSTWVMNFRRGVMRWTQREVVDPELLTVEFHQTEGDFEEFHGSWRVIPAESGCEVVFEVTYDFGIASIAGIMDPLAERVIKRSACSVLASLFGGVTVLDGGEALTDLVAGGV